MSISKKALDSIHKDALWKILKLYGVPQKYITIFQAMYRNTTCCIKTNNGMTEMFDILTGVRQSCILSPFLLLIVIDFVMKKTVNGRDYGITWGSEKLADLDFADDLALLCNTQDELQEMTNSLQCNAAKVGLCFNTEKTKAMVVGNNTVSALTVDGTDVEHVAISSISEAICQMMVM